MIVWLQDLTSCSFLHTNESKSNILFTGWQKVCLGRNIEQKVGEENDEENNNIFIDSVDYYGKHRRNHYDMAKQEER